MGTIKGTDSDDRLVSGATGDTLIGGAGDDTYVVSNLADMVIERAGGGIDTVLSKRAFYHLPRYVENLTFTQPGSHYGTGNAIDNVITGGADHDELHGGAGSDTLHGGGGHDYLWGGTGADTLDGGAGADFMWGGKGNDTYIVDNAGDRCFESPLGGLDTVMASVSWKLSGNFEILELTGTRAINGTGNALANVIIGNDARNTLSGGKGADTLDGGLGNDQLIGGGGADKFRFSSEPDGATNVDRIVDFSQSDHDHIVLDSQVFTALSPGTLDDSTFFTFDSTVDTATDGQPVLYDSATGALSWDPDGTGEGVVFAIVGSSTHPLLTVDDFIVI